MNDTNAAATAAHSAMMTASLSNSTRLVNTRAELATIANTSNVVSRTHPGLRFPRRGRGPRVGSVMGRLYPSQVTQRVDHRGDSAFYRRRWLLGYAVGVLRLVLRTLAAMLEPEGGDHQRQCTHRRHHCARRVLRRGLHVEPRDQVRQHSEPPAERKRAHPRRCLRDRDRTRDGQRMQPAWTGADLAVVDLRSDVERPAPFGRGDRKQRQPGSDGDRREPSVKAVHQDVADDCCAHRRRRQVTYAGRLHQVTSTRSVRRTPSRSAGSNASSRSATDRAWPPNVSVAAASTASHGTRTKARSCANGCGRVSASSSDRTSVAPVWQVTRSTSSVRGPQRLSRTRPLKFSNSRPRCSQP